MGVISDRRRTRFIHIHRKNKCPMMKMAPTHAWRIFFRFRITSPPNRKTPLYKPSSRSDDIDYWIGPSRNMNHQLTAKSTFACKSDEAVQVAIRRGKRTISSLVTRARSWSIMPLSKWLSGNSLGKRRLRPPKRDAPLRVALEDSSGQRHKNWIVVDLSPKGVTLGASLSQWKYTKMIISWMLPGSSVSQ